MPKEPSPSHHAPITFIGIEAKVTSGWQVILDGKSQGYYQNDLAAAKFLAAQMDVQWQVLLKKTKERALPAASAERFQAWMLCLQGTCQCDLDSAVASQSLHCNMFKDDRLLELLSLLGKYGPWRDALYVAWKENKHLQGSRSTPESRSQRALTLLHLAVQKLNNTRAQQSGAATFCKCGQTTAAEECSMCLAFCRSLAPCIWALLSTLLRRKQRHQSEQVHRE